MLKKFILVFIIFSLSLFLLSCKGSDTLPTTTTTTTCVDTTTTTETTTTTTETTTTTTTTTTSTTTTTIPQYDMSSLEGNILSMTEYLGDFYIATDQKIYKIPVSDPTNLSLRTSTPNTESLTSLTAGFLKIGDPPSANYLCGFYTTPGPSFNVFITDLSLNTIEDDNIENLLFSAVTLINPPLGRFYRNNQFIQISFGGESIPSIVDVIESGIVSLDYDSGHFYACNSTTIYKYNDDTFNSPTSLVASSIGAGSDLIGIAFDGTYIWVIDKTTEKLYRIPDGLL